MDWIWLVESYGSLFLFIFSIVEEIVVPLPSAIVSLSAGYLLVTLPFPLSIAEIAMKVALPTGLGSTIGSLFLFFLSMKFMDVIVGNRWFGIGREEYERVRERFEKFGNKDIALVILRAVPIIPFSVVTVVAGAYRYDIKKYLLFTFIGSFIRNFILGILGYAMGEGIFALARKFENYEIAATALIIGGMVWGYVFYRMIEKKIK